MEPPPILDPVIMQMSDILLVKQAASASLAQPRYLKDAAATILDLVAATKEYKDKDLDFLSSDAVVFIAQIWRSYLGSRITQLWPSRELGDIIIEVTMMLYSVKQLVDSGIQTRTSKFRLVRRLKVAWDAPKMKAYRKQLAKGALMAEAEIMELDLDSDRQTAYAASVEYEQSMQPSGSNSTIDHENRIPGDEFTRYLREGEGIAAHPSAEPTDGQSYIESQMISETEDQTYASDDGTSEAEPEELFDNEFSRPYRRINVVLVGWPRHDA